MSGQQDGFALGVDLGTSNTVAVLRWPDGRTRPLLVDGQPILPSGVYADDEGRLHVGRDALRLAQAAPDRYEPNPKRRVDEPDVTLGGRRHTPAALLAAVLRAVGEAAVGAVGFLPPAVVTCPATWDARRRQVLADALALAGWPTAAEHTMSGPIPPGTRLLREPVAAARYYTEVLRRPVPVGESVGVFDFGGGTLDVTIVRNEGADPWGDSGFTVASCGGLDDLGGLDLDAALLALLAERIRATHPAEWTRLAEPANTTQWRDRLQFAENVRGAKEMLSRSMVAPVAVPGIEAAVPLSRDELERVAAPLLRRAVAETRRVVAAAGLTPERLSGLFLVGGSSRMPLVARLLHAELGIAPTVLEQPELPVAEGALTDLPLPRNRPAAPPLPLAPGAPHLDPPAGRVGSGPAGTPEAGPAASRPGAGPAGTLPLAEGTPPPTDPGRPTAAGPAGTLPLAATAPPPADPAQAVTVPASALTTAPVSGAGSAPTLPGPGPAGTLPGSGPAATLPGLGPAGTLPGSGPAATLPGLGPAGTLPAGVPAGPTHPSGPANAAGLTHPAGPADAAGPTHAAGSVGAAGAVGTDSSGHGAGGQPHGAAGIPRQAGPWSGVPQAAPAGWPPGVPGSGMPGSPAAPARDGRRRRALWISLAAVAALAGMTTAAVLYLTRDRHPELDFQPFRKGIPVAAGTERPSDMFTATVGDRAYLAYPRDDDRLVVIAVEAATGSELWRKESGEPAKRWAGVLALPGAVALLADASGSDPRQLEVLDASGKRRWQHTVHGDDELFVGAQVLVVADRTSKQLRGLDLRTGEERWFLPDLTDQYGSSRTRVYPVTIDESLAGPGFLDGTPRDPKAAPVRQLVQVNADRSVRLIDVATGKELGRQTNVARPDDLVAAHEDRLYVVDDQQLLGYDLGSLAKAKPNVLYRFPDDRRRAKALVPCGEHRACLLEVADADEKTARVVAATEGKDVQHWAVPGMEQLVPVGERVLARRTYPEPVVTLFAPDGRKVLDEEDGVAARVDAGNLLLFADRLNSSADNRSVSGVGTGSGNVVPLGELKGVRGESCSWNTEVIVCGAAKEFLVYRFAA
ncbi:Hsp70 family protein [Micromonospora eburnea]|uniref:PQQ-like domain-containing protein n=1 Tax=Micromonospora eburnea TaxID=227316 RepID=A0A1C6VCC4_9ACTN|nr:Hsp70 family protein [Micromonospora eburnea]SCL63979.1 PQQ-like domain-containing protein [Micromonospora eburnea]